MRICITGIGGFAGSFLAELLLSEAHEIHGILSPRNDRSNLTAIENRVTLYSGDLCESNVAVSLLDAIRPDGLILLASNAIPSRSFEQPREVLHTNSLVIINIYEALRTLHLGPRVLCVSSADVYQADPERTLNESSTVRPLNPYGISKYVQELLCGYYRQVHALPSIVVRPFAFTGPRQKPNFAVPSFARQIAEIEHGKKEAVIEVGNLDVVRDYSDVRDIVRGFAATFFHGKDGEVYNLCSGIGTKVREILETLVGYASIPINIKESEARLRPFDPMRVVGDHSKATQEIHWVPTIPLSTTLKDTLDYWRVTAQ